MTKCPCDSQLEYSLCCQPFIQGDKKPHTAVELMRARYSAYALHEHDYVYQTTISHQRPQIDKENISQWSDNSSWLGLKIISCKKGTAEDQDGEVEFIATYNTGKDEVKHHENSWFAKENGEWFFVDGKEIKHQPIVKSERINRNDPCPCNSGLKYKKCCGR